MRGGGLGSRPKKMYGERLGDGVEYHLRRGVGLINFLENGSRPQPPTSPYHILQDGLRDDKTLSKETSHIKRDLQKKHII